MWVSRKHLYISLLIGFTVATNGASSQELSAKEIIRRADDKARGTTSIGTMTLTVVRPGWSRSISMKAWTKGSHFSMIYITLPAKEKGQVFLKRYKEMWNWVPSIERMIKIPPSMMMQSWMGSDFTNDDLVKESSILEDYDHHLISKEIIRDQECYRIELQPLPDAPVTWGKVVVWITTQGFNQWKAEYYDEEMELVNTLHSDEIKNLGDRELPTRMVIEPQNKKGSQTILLIDRMVFNTPIPDTFFSPQNMKTLK